MLDISKIPTELRRGFKRNLTIKKLADYSDFNIEDLPEEQINYIFSRDLDVVTKSLEKYGFEEFSQRIRQFKRNHKKCPNCGKIYECVVSSKYDCPVCIEYNESKNNDKIQKILTTSMSNDSYKTRAAKISETFKNKSAEEKKLIRQKAIKTTEEKYGEDFWSNKSKETWNARTPEEKQKISKKISKTKLEWTDEQKQHFREEFKKTWDKKTPEEKREITEKANKTSMERYGHISRFSDKNHMSKVIKSNIKKYGHPNAALNENVRLKIKQTMIEKYGVENALQNKNLLQKSINSWLNKTAEEILAIKDKFKETNLKKFGVEYQAQRHIKDYENYLNKDFWIKEFGELKQGNVLMDIHGVCKHFGISYTQALDCLKKFEIPYISSSRKNFAETTFLDELSYFLEIDIKRQQKIKPFNFKADGYISDTNFKFKTFEFTDKDKIVIEFLGDYWHGKPNNDELTYFGESFASLHRQTFERFDKIKAEGYKILYIWESDYVENGIGAILEY